MVRFPSSIATARLWLRPLAKDDSAALAAVLADSREHLAGSPMLPAALIARMRPTAERWTFGVFVDGALAGVVSVGFAGCVAELSYWLAAGALGRGYAIEAVRALARVALGRPGTTRLLARCRADNERSQRVARRLGLCAGGPGPDGVVDWVSP